MLCAIDKMALGILKLMIISIGIVAIITVMTIWHQFKYGYLKDAEIVKKIR